MRQFEKGFLRRNGRIANALISQRMPSAVSNGDIMKRFSGFTLVELLVVIAIIGVLFGGRATW